MHYYHRSPNAQGALARRDPVIQNSAPEINTPTPNNSFDGINNLDGFTPPDTVGAIGPSNYVQAVNVRVQVFDRFTGAAQTTANPISSLFTSLGGGSLCATTDDGDPVVLYDQYADRWLIAQFANASSTTGPYYMAIAVSKTSDPTGAYYAYCFQTPNVSGGKFPDYPKIGVWPDGYYMSVNQFDGAGNTYLGAGVYAFNRAKMLAGDPTANFIYFDLNGVDSNFFGLLPSSVDGPLPPPGTPNYFAVLDGVSLGNTSDALHVFQFHADFVNPNLSTFTERAESPVNVAAFTAFSPSSPGVPQSGTSQQLDTLADRLMFRLQYRNFGSNESLVVTHTATGGSGQAGIRYYQLRRNLPGGTFGINEQATYAPDSLHRWMGSAAMNYRGDLGVGYSVSSSSTFPSIRYAARLAGDAPNGLFQGEATLITGGGSQTSAGNRWGDYSCMTLDPTDDCTFWFTTEYYATTSTGGWRTRIGSFSLPGCSPSPRATIHGTVTSGLTGLPLSNAIVRTASGYFRATAADGSYSITLTPGTNDFTALFAGVGTNLLNAVVMTNGESRVQNFTLGAITPVITSNNWSLAAESCLPNNALLDPGETVTINFALRNTGTADTTNLVATLQPTGSVTAPSSPQNYGALTAGGSAVTNPFTFTVSGVCGGTVTATLQLQDGAASLGTVVFSLHIGSTGAGSTAGANPANITINDATTASPYPSTVNISGVSGNVTKVTVTLSNISHTFPDDIDVLLVGPAGQSVVLMSDVGSGTDISGVTLTFDDSAVSSLPDASTLTSGTYKPTNITAGDAFPAPASTSLLGTTLAVFNGQNPNGTWSLYVVDDSSIDSGALGGWSLNITGDVPLCCGDVVPPSISTQPQSQTVLAGAAVNFFVVASGQLPLSYQWYFNSNPIGGATASNYTIASAQPSDAGNYFLVITNESGSVTSAVAALTVNSGFTGVLAGWDVNGQTSYGTSPLAPSTNAGNITVVGLTRGSGVTTTGSAASRAWGGNGFTTSSAGAAVTAVDLATFSITANAGYKVSFASISKFDYRRSSSGPTDGVVQYQVGAGAFTGFATNAYASGNGGHSLAAIDLSGVAALQNVGPGTNVTFRIVNYNGAASGTWYIYDVANSTALDFAVTGSIAAAAAPPASPPTLSLVGLTGNQFQFTLTGTTGSSYVVEVATNLPAANWIPVRTSTAPILFTEPATNDQRYYRGRIAP